MGLLVPALRLGALVLLLAGCRESQRQPQAERGKPLSGGDSAWQWVEVPNRRQCTDGVGVAAGASEVYVAATFSRGFAGNCPLPHWGGRPLDLRGEVNFFVARHGADGALHWVRRYGDGGRVTVSAIALGPDASLYVVGNMVPGISLPGRGHWDTGAGSIETSSATAFLARLDSAGNVRWAKSIEGAGVVSAVAVDSAGRVYVTGGTVPELSGSPETGPVFADSGDAYVASYSADGRRRWFHIVAQGGYARAAGLAVTLDGICAVGTFEITDQASVAGKERARSRTRGFAMGLSRTGAPLWRDTLSAYLQTAASDSAGACYTGGSFAGVLHVATDTLTSVHDPEWGKDPNRYTDAVLVKYDRRGRLQWARRGIGGPVSDFMNGVAVTRQGRIVVTGDFMGAGDFGSFRLTLPARATGPGSDAPDPRAIFVAAFSETGDVLRVVQNVPAGKTRAGGIAVAPDGAVYVTGTQQQDATYGMLKRPNPEENMFLARLSIP